MENIAAVIWSTSSSLLVTFYSLKDTDAIKGFKLSMKDSMNDLLCELASLH